VKKIEWPDGSISQAQTWSEMLRDLRREQFRRYSAIGLRFEMRRRARTWSGKFVCLFCRAPRFMHELAAAKMFVILSDD
jgi:hypothetical protein